MHVYKIAQEAVEKHGALQKINELAGFLAVIIDLAPQVIVEIGSDVGGTLWAWQQIGARRVIGVDLPNAKFSSGCYAMRTSNALDAHGSEVVYGDSHTQATYDALVQLLAGDPVDVLFIDGDHSYDGVLADWDRFSKLTRLVALHDIVPGTDGRAVDALWAILRASYDTREWVDPASFPVRGETLGIEDGGIGAVLL